MARIMTHVVVAEVEASKLASLELNAPIGVGVDLNTGELSEWLESHLLAIPCSNKRLFRASSSMKASSKSHSQWKRRFEVLLYLPIYSVTKIDGIKPEDHVVEVSELEHISVSGLPDVVPWGILVSK